MCESCERRAERDRVMWEAIRLGLISMSRGLGAIVKAIERRHASGNNQRAA